MEKYKIFSILILIFLIVSCSEKSDSLTEPNTNYPDKLYPYETFFDLSTFQQRRDQLTSNIPANAIAIVATNDLYLRNGDIDYEFRTASNFYYLTGFEEPNAIAVMRRKTNNTDASELI
ncbi:MAG: aminopeptidase P N-terminal domain-containing protein, partial [Calditrichaceae bacterium]